MISIGGAMGLSITDRRYWAAEFGSRIPTGRMSPLS